MPVSLPGALALLTFGWIAVGAPLSAQDSASVPALDQPTAPVVVDGATLFRVRGVSAYPAERRAAEISGRIAAAAANRAVPLDSIVVRETPLGSVVTAAGTRLFAVLEADAQLEGVDRAVLAELYRSRVVDAVVAFRQERQPRALWQQARRALVATLVLVLALWLASRLLRALRRLLDRRYQARIQDLHFRSIPIVQGQQLWQALHRVIGLVALLTAFVAGYVYLSYVLQLFPWTRALGGNLSAMLLGPLATLGAGAIRYAPNFIFLFILALITRYVLKAVRLVFKGIADGTFSIAGFDAEWAAPSDRIIRLLVIAFALVIAYPYIPGSGSEAFKGISILLGVLFSLGSQAMVGNLIAGQSIAFRRAFRVGDRIRIGEHVGEVTQIRLLTTYLRSPKNEQIVLPNSLILGGEVVNYSTLASDQGVILHTTVRIGYETPWRQVEAMLLEAADRTPGVLKQPAPFVLQQSLGEFAVTYELNAHTDNPQAMPRLYSALHQSILDVFNEYGVQIMVPAYEGDPEEPKVVPPAKWFTEPARPADESSAAPTGGGSPEQGRPS